MRSTLLSLLITFSPLLLIHDHGALAQCSKTWTLPSSGLKGDAYQVFGECRRRGDIGIAWKTTGLDGDKYKVILKSGSANVEYAVERTGASSGSSHAIKRGNGWYGHVVFQCRKGGVFPGKCEMGTLQYKIVDCACPTNMKPTRACNFSKFESAKDVQCESLPPPPKPYRFEYEVKDFTFEPTPLDSIETEKISTSSNGIIKNCADGVTAEHTLDMSLSIENSQSMTVSKSFTSSKMQEISAGVSVTVEAQAGAIFASSSVAATAKLETKHSWEESATEVGGRFIKLVNLGLMVCTDSYVVKALPECDGSVLKNIWKVYGQTKSAKKLPPPISLRSHADGSTNLAHIGNKPADLALQKY